jgi:hypothetical protein
MFLVSKKVFGVKSHRRRNNSLRRKRNMVQREQNPGITEFYER